MRKNLLITSLLFIIFAAACSKQGDLTDTGVANNRLQPAAANETSTVATGSGMPAARAIDDEAATPVESKNPLPPPTGFVNDYAKVIDARTMRDLERTLKRFQDKSKIEFRVAIIDTTGGQPSVDYAIATARGWGIGTKDGSEGGVILLVAINDRRWEIRWTRKLEADLQTGTAEELTRRMTTPFRQGKYGEGITKGVDAVITKLESKRGSP